MSNSALSSTLRLRPEGSSVAERLGAEWLSTQKKAL